MLSKLSKKMLLILLCSLAFASMIHIDHVLAQTIQPEQGIISELKSAIYATTYAAQNTSKQIWQFTKKHKLAIEIITGIFATIIIASNLKYIQHDLIGDGILRNLPDSLQSFIDKNIVGFTTTEEAREGVNKEIEALDKLGKSALQIFRSANTNTVEIQHVQEGRTSYAKSVRELTRPEEKESYIIPDENAPVNDEAKSLEYRFFKNWALPDYIKEFKERLSTTGTTADIKFLQDQISKDINLICHTLKSYLDHLSVHTHTPEKQILSNEINKIVTDQCSPNANVLFS